MVMVEASVNVSKAFCVFASAKHSLQFTRQPPQLQLNPQQLINHEGLSHLAALWVPPDAVTPDAHNGTSSVNGRPGDERCGVRADPNAAGTGAAVAR